ncbi:hypothetical protein E1301_Tti003850 [Triplophysa tibetana]|uniref:Uncharacterized protein n=1 Tax=Triplophysa tibetana TaxID=1572043 RepID=A0A5A9PSH7_9TELE|nr:hypothetical protein E1301_Tti003850 [Triplophysa tibetana]
MPGSVENSDVDDHDPATAEAEAVLQRPRANLSPFTYLTPGEPYRMPHIDSFFQYILTPLPVTFNVHSISRERQGSAFPRPRKTERLVPQQDRQLRGTERRWSVRDRGEHVPQLPLTDC